MDDLIARFEAAEEGSRELDEDIALEIGWAKAFLSKHRYWNMDVQDANEPNRRNTFCWPHSPIAKYRSDTGEEIILGDTPWSGWAWECDLPRYTTSLDAALTLVPDEARSFFDVVSAQYLAGPQMTDFGNEFRAITHLQIELLAARVSALNQCTY